MIQGADPRRCLQCKALCKTLWCLLSNARGEQTFTLTHMDPVPAVLVNILLGKG